MATPPKRPHRVPISPQLSGSSGRREKKISIEGNIGEFRAKLNQRNKDDHKKIYQLRGAHFMWDSGVL